MLSSLTSYLIQHRQVYIPHIGKFELRYKSATLDFANRIIHPPVNELRFSEHGNMRENQLSFLKEDMEMDSALVEDRLKDFGKSLKRSVTQSAFTWNGFGELKYINNEIVFLADAAPHLTPVPANKLIRKNVHHAVLVGEREMHSGDTSYIHPEKKVVTKSVAVIIGWVVTLLAVGLIGYYLYKSNFHPLSTGTKQKLATISLIQSPVI